ncbi:hypothetical protein M2275_003097 [Rhodococcus opacus]|nr:hypothetical protein [Rhodococcus opacus]
MSVNTGNTGNTGPLSVIGEHGYERPSRKPR